MIGARTIRLVERLAGPAEELTTPQLRARLNEDLNGVLCRLPGADPEQWFPVGSGVCPTYARLVCKGCPLVPPCLAYALRRPQAGIWGGTTEEERLAVLRHRLRVSAARPPAEVA